MNIRNILPHLVLVALLIIAPLVLTADSIGRITGIVIDAITGDPLIGASILIEGKNIGTNSDFDGNFVVLSVPPGVYKVSVSCLGYETLVIEDVKIEADQTTDLKIQMKRSLIETGKVTVVDESKKGIDINQTGTVSIKTDKDKKFAPAATADDLLSRESGATRSPDGDLVTRGGRVGEIHYNSGGGEYSKAQSYSKIAPQVHQNCVPPPPPYYPQGGCAIVNGEPFDAMFFKNYGVNPFVDTEDDHLSTFAIDVDDASFTLTRSYLDRGYLPPDEAVRIEEFVNHFDYEYEAPRREPFEVYIEGAPSRFGQNCQLLRIGIQGRNISRTERKPANLIFLVDVSGSMNREDRLELVKEALMYLVDQLDPGDRVGLVTYESSAREIFEPISVRNRHEIYLALGQLRPSGSTNLDHGLELAYRMAERHFQSDRINRIVLCSDGVANVGTTSAEGLLKKTKRFADRGITLTAIGVGMGNHNDALLEQLGDKGDGQYAYVDNIDEARRIFIEKLTGTLQVIARDVKIQVDFNPDVVQSYRLLGYENRDVADNKFRDDREDGGEIGAGHQVTALYEIKLHDHKRARDLGRINIRFKDAEGYEVNEIARTIPFTVFARSFESSSPYFRLAACAAEFSEILKKSYWARGSSLYSVYTEARRVADELHSSEVDELLRMIHRAENFEDALAEHDGER